ncbi:Hypothetical predicted protein [Octopus vulgaris]|uniref:SCAN domain-containing protein 3-like n=1 Tax=Octopus vulgaris TaxID=6645 RepID=A0AA36AGJ6_OCTVU|nr:Hypothetical predicted protein [Octopus vulgaris]
MDEMFNFVEEKIVEILQKTNFSIQIDDSTIHNQAILLVYVRFIHEDDIRDEMLFIKSLSETTNGEDIVNEVMQYFNDKSTPLTNLINIASDGAAAMTGKVKDFVSRMKLVAPHIFYIHCIIYRQHLVAKNIGGHIEEARNTAIHAINFVKSNSMNNRFFTQFCGDEDFKTLFLHTESQMTHYNSKKQADIAKKILERLSEFKSKIFYLSDIFKTVNLLNLELQGRKSDLFTCSQKIKGNTIHNQAILLVYVRFIHEDDIRDEMLFIKSLSETTNREDIVNEVMQYFNDKSTPLTNLINIASDGAAAMTGKVKGFVTS